MIDLEIKDFVNFSQGNPLIKRFEWNTSLVKFDSGIEQRMQNWNRPLRRWELNWQIIDRTSRNNLLEIFNRSKGIYDTFKLLDDDEYQGSLTIPSGTSGAYQLNHDYYSSESETWNEDKTLIVADSITIADYSEVASSPGAGEFTLDDNTGIVTFGDTLSGDKACTFQYYFLVRFDFDQIEDKMSDCELFSFDSIPIIEVIPT